MKHVAILAALLLLPLTTLAADDYGSVLWKTLEAYGDAGAWVRLERIEARGRVVPAMRKGDGVMTRTWSNPGNNLRVEIVYPDKTEVRALEDGKGTVNGRPASAMELDAMRLQAARLRIPRLLERKGGFRELGVHDGVYSVEIALDPPLTLTIDIDPKTLRIVRSVGRSGEMSFTTVYSDFRKVDGLLIPFHEENSAMGMKTADIYLEKVEVVKR